MTTTEILIGIKTWVLSKLNLKQDVINDLANIRSGAQAGSTAVQPSDLDAYTKNDGYYEGMGVGTADNLTGQTERTNDSMYRKSGGIEEVATGVATIANIKGKTVVWNQMVQNGNFANNTTTDWALRRASSSFSDGVITVTCTVNGDSGLVQSGCKAIEGHKYLITFKYNSVSKAMSVGFGGYTNLPAINSLTVYKTIKTAKTNTSNLEFIRGSGVVYDSFQLDCNYGVKIIDLTLIYGEGNEPSTPEQFEADYFKWFGKPLTYEPYDAGSLRSVQLDAIKTTGFNQWDEEWEVGAINFSTGVNQSSSSHIRSKNFIPCIPRVQYYIKDGTATDTNVYFYDVAKNFISALGIHETQLFTATTNCYYIRFRVNLTTYNHDICINISNPSKNGTYEPYEEHVASLPVTTLTGKLNGEGESVTIFPDGMKSAGDVANEIYTIGDKTYAVQRVGSVDLGSLTYTYVESTSLGNTFTAQITGAKNANNSIISTCGIYVSKSASYFYYQYGKTTDKIVGIEDGNRIRVHDFSYTDTATFKAAMNGVMLYYALEEPLVYEVEGFTLPKPYIVDGGGTEEQVQKANVQGLAAILTCIYGVDAVGILDKLPRNYISEKSMDNFLAQLNTVTGGVWTKTWNDNTGKWDFSFTPNA